MERKRKLRVRPLKETPLCLDAPSVGWCDGVGTVSAGGLMGELAFPGGPPSGLLGYVVHDFGLN